MVGQNNGNGSQAASVIDPSVAETSAGGIDQRQWGANQTARMMAQYAQDLYIKYGGNITLYTVNPQYNYVGTYTGPQEIAQMQDAKKVVAGMLKNLAEVYQRELDLNWYVPLGPNAIVGPGGYNPLQHLYWTPETELNAVQGQSPKAAFLSLTQSVGYDYGSAADLLARLLSRYPAGLSVDANALWPNVLLIRGAGWLDATSFLNIRNGNVGALAQNVPVVIIDNGTIGAYVAFDTTMGLQEGQALIAQYPPGTPAFGQPRTWRELLYNEIANPPGSGPTSAGAKLAAAGMGARYISETYGFVFGDQNDAKGFFLDQNDTSILSHWEPVPIEAKLLAQKGQAIATQNKIAYSIWHMVAGLPLSPQDVKALKLASTFQVSRPFPIREAAWMLVAYMLNVQPIVDSTMLPPGWAWSTPDFNGKPKTAFIANNPAYQLALEDLWRAALSYAAVTGYAQLLNFGALKNPDGTFELDPDGVTPTVSMWGSCIKFVLNPDKTPALIYFDNNDQYADLAGAKAKKLVSDVQLANVFDFVVGIDPVLAPLLGLARGTPSGPNAAGTPNKVDTTLSTFNQDVANDFYDTTTVAGRNNAVMCDAWVNVGPMKPAPWTPTPTPVVIPPVPQPAPDVGPYGELNPQTA